MSKEAIKQKLISVGVNLEREEIDYSYAMTLVNELLDDYVKLILPVVGKSVKEKNIPTFKEHLEINFVRTKESRYKCIYTKIVYSRDEAFKNYKRAFNVEP